MIKKNVAYTIIALSSIFLSACGGGGNDGGKNAPPPPPQQSNTDEGYIMEMQHSIEADMTVDSNVILKPNNEELIFLYRGCEVKGGNTCLKPAVLFGKRNSFVNHMWDVDDGANETAPPLIVSVSKAMDHISDLSYADHNLINDVISLNIGNDGVKVGRVVGFSNHQFSNFENNLLDIGALNGLSFNGNSNPSGGDATPMVGRTLYVTRQTEWGSNGIVIDHDKSGKYVLQGAFHTLLGNMDVAGDIGEASNNIYPIKLTTTDEGTGTNTTYNGYIYFLSLNNTKNMFIVARMEDAKDTYRTIYIELPSAS